MLCYERALSSPWLIRLSMWLSGHPLITQTVPAPGSMTALHSIIPFITLGLWAAIKRSLFFVCFFPQQGYRSCAGPLSVVNSPHVLCHLYGRNMSKFLFRFGRVDVACTAGVSLLQRDPWVLLPRAALLRKKGWMQRLCPMQLITEDVATNAW